MILGGVFAGTVAVAATNDARPISARGAPSSVLSAEGKVDASI